MSGPALEITSIGDLFMWGGLAVLTLLYVSALVYPRLSHR
jgi:hypothetical protein